MRPTPNDGFKDGSGFSSAMPGRPAVHSLLVLVLCTLSGGSELHAVQNLPLPETQKHEFVSTYTGRHYQLRVGLPRNYDPTRRRYTVVYQLDAQWDFVRTWAITRALEFDGRMEPMIVCGITYAGENPDYGALRARDYTPTDTAGNGSTGQAAKFLNTLRSEIIPLMEANYPCRGDERLLMGSSYGGLFTAYSLLNAPELFTGYVMSSPSCWFDNEVIVTRAQQWHANIGSRPIKARIITGESESGIQKSSAQRFYNALKAHGLANLDLTLAFEPVEQHGAVAEMAYLKGLPEVVQPKLVTLTRGDGAARDWTPKVARVDWPVDAVTVSVDAETQARRRVVLNDPNSPERISFAYGVIYVLDGQWDYRMVDAHYGSLVYDREASNAILRVGLDWDAPRMRDLMAWREQAFAPGAGADRYRTWVRQVAMPGAETLLTSEPFYRMVLASEKAAHWALADLLSEEPTFDRYLLVSPDVTWADNALRDLEATRAARGGDLRARLLIYTGGAEAEATVRAPLAAFLAQLRSRNYPNLSIEHVELAGRGYAQAKYEGYHKGLRKMIR